MNKEKVIKIASLGLTLVGAVVSVATTIVEDKKLDGKITEKVAEKFADLSKNGES